MHWGMVVLSDSTCGEMGDLHTGRLTFALCDSSFMCEGKGSVSTRLTDLVDSKSRGQCRVS